MFKRILQIFVGVALVIQLTGCIHDHHHDHDPGVDVHVHG
jgi:hypothetical protein